MREVVQPRSRVAQGRRRAAPGLCGNKKPRRSGALGPEVTEGFGRTSLLEEGTKSRRELHVHAFHSAHSAHSSVGMASGVLLLFDQLGNHRLGGEEQPGNRSRILQRRAAHLGRIEHAHFDHIAELLGLGVEAEVALALRDLVHHDRRLRAGVGNDLAERLLERTRHDPDARILIGVLALELIERCPGADIGHAAAGDNAFLDRGTRRVQSIFDASFLFFHLDLGRRTDLDHRNAAGELRYALLQLFLVVVAGRFVDLGTDVLDPRLDRLGIAGPVDDGGFFLRDLDAFRAPEILESRLFEGLSDFLGNDLAAGEDGDVFEHGFAAIPEPGSLDGAGLENSAQVVHDERGECLAFDFLGDDEKRFAGLGHLLQDRQQFAYVGDLLVVQKNIGLLQHRNLFFRVVDEIRREIPAVELHAFDHLEFVLQTLAVLDRDHPFLADFVHRIGDDLADRLISVGGNSPDLGDFLARGAGLGELLQLLDDRDDSLVNPAFKVHRVHSGGYELHTLSHDRLGEHCRSSRAVPRDVRSFRGDFLHHLSAHVLELVLQLDFLGNRHAVLGYGGRTEGPFQYHIAAPGAEGHLDRGGEDIHASEQLVPRRLVETYVFCRHCWLLNWIRWDLLGDDAHDVVFAHDQILGAFDLYRLARVFSEQDAVADFDVERAHLAVFENLAFADRDDFALIGLLPGGVGNDDPACRLVFRIETLHHDAVVQGANFGHHWMSSFILKELAATNWRCGHE